MVYRIILSLTFFSLANTFSYNEKEAYKYVAYAMASYCDPDNISNWKVAEVSQQFPDMTDINVVTSKQENVQGYIGYDSKAKVVVVAFRGSSNIANWLDNLSYLPTKYPGSCGGNIHHGFYRSYSSIKPALTGLVNIYRARYPNSSLYVVGHSLGAAMATLMAIDLADAGIQPNKLVTAGSPRVGDEQFWKCFEKLVTSKTDHYRLVHEKDMVPHVPSNGVHDYMHVNREVWYVGDGYRICNTDYGEDHTCSYQYDFFQTNFEDHVHYLGWDQQNLNCK